MYQDDRHLLVHCHLPTDIIRTSTLGRYDKGADISYLRTTQDQSSYGKYFTGVECLDKIEECVNNIEKLNPDCTHETPKINLHHNKTDDSKVGYANEPTPKKSASDQIHFTNIWVVNSVMNLYTTWRTYNTFFELKHFVHN